MRGNKTTLVRFFLALSVIGLWSCAGGPRIGRRLPALDGLRLITRNGDVSGQIPPLDGHIRVIKFWGKW